MEEIILYTLICLGVIGLLIYFNNPLKLKLEKSKLTVKTSVYKNIGLFIFLSYMPLLMILIWRIVDIDSVLVYVFSFIIFFSYFISIVILLTYVFYDKNRFLVIDFENKNITETTKYFERKVHYDSKIQVDRVSSKWTSFINPLSSFEYLIIDKKIVITNTSVNLDGLIEMMNLSKVHNIKKHFPFIKLE